MTDQTSLAAKLAKLAKDTDVYEGAARIVVTGGLPDPVTAILTEIDETVLTAKLLFTADAGTVEMIASGRRLDGITAVTGDVACDAALLGQTVAHDDTEKQALLASFMRDFCAATQSLRVTALPAKRLGSGSELGMTARQLAESWGAVEMALEGPPMQRFRTLCGDALSAIIQVSDGEISEQSGDTDLLEHLMTCVEDQLLPFDSDRADNCPDHRDPSLTCWRGAIDGETAIGVAIHGQDIAIFAIANKDVNVIHHNWRRAT